jgi:nitrate/TMAO reductase-like tetraheme cytochrome c subunit
VRYAIAVLILPPSIFALGFFTAWRIGFGPLDPWLAGKVDWFELVQVAWALLVALFSLRAWWKPAVKVDEIEVYENHSSASLEHPHTRKSVQLPRFKTPRFHLPESWTSHPNGIARPKARKGIKAKERPIPMVNRVVIPKPIKSTRAKHRRSISSKPEVQFSVYEEHRCPYCLDEVKRNDPRGVKECEVCHSLHHADCWNITGMCQVPHLNT